MLFVVSALGVDFAGSSFGAAEQAQGGVVARESFPKLRSSHPGLADDRFGGAARSFALAAGFCFDSSCRSLVGANTQWAGKDGILSGLSKKMRVKISIESNLFT